MLGQCGTPFLVERDSEDTYTKRVLAAFAGVDVDKIENGDVTAAEMAQISEAATLLNEAPIYIGAKLGVAEDGEDELRTVMWEFRDR